MDFFNRVVRTPLALLLLISIQLIAVPQVSVQETSPRNYLATVTLPVEEGDAIYKDHLNFSVDHPALKLTDVKIATQAESEYDPTFKETKKIYPKDVVAQLTLAASADAIPDANVHISYYQRSHKKITQERLPMALPTVATEKAVDNKEETMAHQDSCPSYAQESATAAAQQPTRASWSQYLSNLFTTTSSWWFRLVLAFLMGLILSLTPCIYPMIPITVAILQSHGRKSMWYNFLYALAYTMGIATTFAILGLIAAFTGGIFGAILNNPLVILIIVGFFVYLAGSMLGLYEMYLPRWMQNSNGGKQGSSPLSAFLFGAVSGTIASPCLTPGLLFLLTYVCQLQSMFLGFILLFVFGIGTSMPLLLIGTFSNIVQFLPNAGMWMVEIKKFFGFLMLGMSIYFLKGILPGFVIYLLIALLLAAAGIFYLYEATHVINKNSGIKKLLGIALIVAAIPLLAKTYMVYVEEQTHQECSIWLENYENARTTAQQQNKKLLVFMSGPFCSICKLIEGKFFTNTSVCKALDAVVTVKIKDTNNAIGERLIQQFNVKGVPTLLLLNPTDETEIKRWGSELYDKSIDEFVAELHN